MLSYTQKVWAVGFRPLIKQMNFYQSWLCVEIIFIMVPWHATNGAIHKARKQGKRKEGLNKSVHLVFWGRHAFAKMRTREERCQTFDLIKRTHFMDGPNPWKYYPRNFCGKRSFNGSNISIL